MISERKLAANRANAQRSTGPKTDEGKAASRRNALKHGMRAEAVLPDDLRAEADALAARWADELRPEGGVEEALVARAALEVVRLDRLAKQEDAVLARQVREAGAAWDDEQARQAEALAARIEDDPARVTARLRQFAAGCDWMAGHWRSLAATLEEGGLWGGDEYRAAALLLGLDPESGGDDPRGARAWRALMGMDPATDPDEADHFFEESTAHLDPDARLARMRSRLPGPDEARADLLALVGEEVAGLEAQAAENWESLDGHLRAEAEDRALLDASPEGALRLRYEAAAKRGLFGALDRLAKGREAWFKDRGRRAPRGTPAPLPAPIEPKAPSPSRPAPIEPNAAAGAGAPIEANATHPEAGAPIEPNAARPRRSPEGLPGTVAGRPSPPAPIEANAAGPRRGPA